jgi:nucleolar MIF4G domain-containing protein 1
VLNFAYLQPKTKTFVEILLITIFLHDQKSVNGKRDKKYLAKVFSEASAVPQMIPGLQYFLLKVVKSTDLAGSKAERSTIKWGSAVAGDVLVNIASTATGVAEVSD